MSSSPSVIFIPNPPVGELVAFVRAHFAEVCEQVVEGVSGQVQSSAGLMCVKEVDHIHAKVSLEPLDVRVGAMKYLRAGKKAHAAETSPVRLLNKNQKPKTKNYAF